VAKFLIQAPYKLRKNLEHYLACRGKRKVCLAVNSKVSLGIPTKLVLTLICNLCRLTADLMGYHRHCKSRSLACNLLSDAQSMSERSLKSSQRLKAFYP